MRFAELASEMVTDPALLEELNALLAVKMRAGEAATSPRWPGLHDFILRELEAAQAHVPVAGDRPDLAGSLPARGGAAFRCRARLK